MYTLMCQLHCFNKLHFQIRKFGENNFKAGNGRPGLGFGPFGHDFASNLGNNLRVQGVYVDEKLQCIIICWMSY